MTKSDRIRLYERQGARLQRQLDQLEGISRRYALARLLVFGIVVALSLVALYTVGQWLFWPLLVVGMLIFTGLVYQHQKVERSIGRFAALRTFAQQQIARATIDWAQMPAARGAPPRYDHPFEADLDLVGEFSLHRLLDTTTAAQASAQLRTWLTLAKPDLATTQDRQTLVRALIPQAILRHKLAVDGRLLANDPAGWDAEKFLRWLSLSKPAITQTRRWVIGLAALAAINAVLFVAAQLGGLEPWWRYSFALYAALYLLQARALGEVFHEAAALRDDLQRLATLFRHVEHFRFDQSPALRDFCAPFQANSQRPSQQLRRILWLVAATGLQGNPVLAIALNAVVPWGLYFAYRLDQTKVDLADLAPRWLARWYALEALSALANAAELNPQATFPQLRTDADPPVFFAQQMGHPLLTETGKVRNDFTFNQLGEVIILTGSNMSGKSTFLKALGVNLALAGAGGVVDAARLESTLFRLFTCIKVSDSVTSGVSYFYAEVRRLKELLTALECVAPQPLFFCIDEIFRGTNNRERLLGSQAYIQALVDQHGVGLIATHDLELVKLADDAAQISNYHFRDDLVAERMVFDYRLRPGPSPTTNALKIMRSAGLPTPDSEECGVR